MGVDAERMLQSIHTNFVILTHRVPMAQVEDFPKAMQWKVVAVPRAWVRLFRWLARAVVMYHDHNPPPPQDQTLRVYMFCTTMYYMMEALKDPLLYMTLCITTFLIYKIFYGDLFIYLHV